MYDQLDFSKIERIVPKNDSWEKVCARLDKEGDKNYSVKGKLIPFRITVFFPFAAAFVIAGIAVILSVFSKSNEVFIPMEHLSPNELVSWYENLGETDIQEFETLDEHTSISYYIK